MTEERKLTSRQGDDDDEQTSRQGDDDDEQTRPISNDETINGSSTTDVEEGDNQRRSEIGQFSNEVFTCRPIQ